MIDQEAIFAELEQLILSEPRLPGDIDSKEVAERFHISKWHANEKMRKLAERQPDKYKCLLVRCPDGIKRKVLRVIA